MSLLICATNAMAEFKEIKQPHFRISAPDGFIVKQSAPVEDFELYSVQQREKKFVVIYIGNFPRFPKNKQSSAGSVQQFRTREVKINTYSQGGNLVGREILIDLTAKSGGPQFLHAWISDVTLAREEIHLADKILMSLDLSPPSKE